MTDHTNNTKPATAEPLYVVFDGPPAPESGRFVEVEDADGCGVDYALEWKQREDGLWTLGPFYAVPSDVEACLDNLAHAERGCRKWCGWGEPLRGEVDLPDDEEAQLETLRQNLLRKKKWSANYDAREKAIKGLKAIALERFKETP
jgi:hypothetical protein